MQKYCWTPKIKVQHVVRGVFKIMSINHEIDIQSELNIISSSDKHFLETNIKTNIWLLEILKPIMTSPRHREKHIKISIDGVIIYSLNKIQNTEALLVRFR